MNISTVWHALYWAWIASEVAILLLTRTRRSSGKVQDRGSILILWVVIVLAITGGKWFGEMHPNADFHGAQWVRPFCVLLLAAALALRWTAVLTLGRSFSANVAIRSTQTLHKTGLYRFIRHPSYTGLLLIFVAVGLRTLNWAALVIVLVPILAAMLYRIHIEEAALRGAFGTEYTNYSRTTKRLIPGLY
jgi:protein-S-isoprenylcysteine O-methyltransferase Ste14